jgi:hypothetical protein
MPTRHQRRELFISINLIFSLGDIRGKIKVLRNKCTNGYACKDVCWFKVANCTNIRSPEYLAYATAAVLLFKLGQI